MKYLLNDINDHVSGTTEDNDAQKLRTMTFDMKRLRVYTGNCNNEYYDKRVHR